MTDRYEKIRKALEMGPTPGDWDADFASAMRNGSPAVVEYFVRRDGDDISIAADIVNPSSGLPSAVNANYIAACDPDTIRELLEERDALREVLQVLVNWTPSADTYRRLGFDPETPMRAHEAAKALLLKKDTHEGR